MATACGAEALNTTFAASAVDTSVVKRTNKKTHFLIFISLFYYQTLPLFINLPASLLLSLRLLNFFLRILFILQERIEHLLSIILAHLLIFLRLLLRLVIFLIILFALLILLLLILLVLIFVLILILIFILILLLLILLIFQQFLC